MGIRFVWMAATLLAMTSCAHPGREDEAPGSSANEGNRSPSSKIAAPSILTARTGASASRYAFPKEHRPKRPPEWTQCGYP